MNFSLTKQEEMVRTIVRQFAENEVKPIAAEIDQTERYPMEIFKRMAELNLFGVNYPKEYGGAGGNTVCHAIIMYELAKACATVGTIYGAHAGLCMGPIFDFGTEEQKQKYLVPLMKGEKIGAFALTEPNAGSDSSAQQTTAVRDGDHYVLNGNKIFITNAGVADVFIIAAMTDKSKGNKGISMFIVERNFPGFSIGKQEDKMGIRASSTCELIFQDCIVPAENLVGQENGGFKLFMKTLDESRIGVAIQAAGIAAGALEETIKYSKERKQFGKPLAKFQGLQWMMADMATACDAAELLCLRAADRKDRKLDFTKEVAMAKLFAATTTMDVTTKAVQIHGGYGYIKDYPVERMMRDAKITEIYEGTSQVQKMVISGKILK